MSTQPLITCDFIVGNLKEWIENKQPIGPEVFLDAALKLTVLMGDEAGKLFVLQQNVANLRYMEIELGSSVAKARAKVEATDLYRQMKVQEAKLDQIQEFVRIAKLQARTAQAERSNY